MLRRALPTLAAFSLVAATVLGATASSAQAAVVANQFTVTPTTITAGDSVSISASFRIAPPARHNQVVTIHLTSPTTGTVSPTVASHTGFSSCIALATTIECHFPSGAGNGAVGTVNATVATSADATGTFNASATYVDSHTASTLIAGPTTVTITAPMPDLAVSKTPDQSQVLPGQTVTYTIDYENQGSGSAANVELQDSVPSGLTLDSVNTSGSPHFDTGDCSGTTVIVCTTTSVASGESGTIQVITTVDATVVPGDVITNTASIATTTTETDLTNNSASADVTVAPFADLEVSKSSPTPVNAGDQFSYTVIYNNHGPSDAVNVVVDDTLPSDVTLVSATPDQGSCTGTLCDLGTLVSGGTGQITIVVDTDPTFSGIVDNAAAISSETFDPDMTNNAASFQTTITPSADLSIVKSAPSSVFVGDTFVYSLMWENQGPSTATGAFISDILPGLVSYVSDDAGCTHSGGTVSCPLGSIAPGASGTVEITVNADAAGQAMNTSTITTPSIADPDETNNLSEATTTIEPSANVSVKKSGPLAAIVGDTFDYTITYANFGPSDAENVSIADSLPSQVSYVSDDAGCSETSGVVTCALGTLSDDAKGSITITVTAISNGPATNGVEILTRTHDPDTSNNTDEMTTTIDPPTVDVEVAKAAPTDVLVGDVFEYDVLYENHGPSDATNVVITDTLPPGVTFVSATPDTGSCGEAGGVITCTVGTVTPGHSGSIIVEAIANTPGIATNTATISSTEADTNPDNNTATAVTTINPQPVADLAIAKVASSDQVAAGNDITYTVTYANAGPSNATDVQVTDTLPAGVTFVSATPDVGVCNEVGGVVTCSLGDVATGGGGTIAIVVSVPASAPDGTLSNSAEIVSPTPDPTPTDNTAVADVMITASGGLPVTGSDTKDMTAVALALLITGTLLLLFRRANLRRAGA